MFQELKRPVEKIKKTARIGVYKRQKYVIIEPCLLCIWLCIYPNWNRSIYAVSYTHLDVYKRQIPEYAKPKYSLKDEQSVHTDKQNDKVNFLSLIHI